MLDFNFEDIDGVDDDAGEEQEPPPMGRWRATSSYDIYMVDTPKETNGDEAMEDNPSRKKAKYERHQRHPKPRHNNTGTGVKNYPDDTEDECNPDQPAFEQAGQATDGYLEEDNYMPPFEDEVSLGDDDFGMPEDPA